MTLEISKKTSQLSSSSDTANGEHKCSFSRTVFNLVMTSIGIGILELPHALMGGGWIPGLGLLFLSYFASLYCCNLLYKALMHNATGKMITSFEDLGRSTFGMPGMVVCGAMLYITLFFVLVIMILLLGLNMYGLTNVLDVQAWIWLSFAALLPFTWLPTMKEIGIMSALGVVSVFVLVVVIISGCVSDVVSADDLPESSMLPDGVMPFFSSFCTYLLSFCVTVTVPNVVDSMHEPKQFPRAGMWAFSLIVIVYGLISVGGYLAYGNSLSLAENSTILDPVARIGAVFNVLLRVSIVVLVLCHYLVLYAPWAKLLDNIIGMPDPSKVSTKGAVMRSVCRSVFTVLVTVVAAYGPSVKVLLSLLGAVTVVSLSVILPIVFYWKTLKQTKTPHPSKPLLALEVSLLVFGVVAIGAGSYMAIKETIHEMSGAH